MWFQAELRVSCPRWPPLSSNRSMQSAFGFRSKSTRGSLGPNFPAALINRVVPADLATCKFDSLLLGGKFPRGPAPHALAARFVRHWVDFKRRRIRFVLCRIVVCGHPLILIPCYRLSNSILLARCTRPAIVLVSLNPVPGAVSPPPHASPRAKPPRQDIPSAASELGQRSRDKSPTRGRQKASCGSYGSSRVVPP